MSKSRINKKWSSAESSATAVWPKSITDEFVKNLIIRGEAALPRKDGSLPPGATHAIVGTDDRGMPVVERRRYSAV